MSAPLLAGVEMGGTKCVCTYGTGPTDVRDQVTLPTRDPVSTMESIAATLDRWSATLGAPAAIGIASFGPVDLNRDSPTYGHLGATPKKGWPKADLLGFFKRRYSVPCGFSTDVIGAALAEGRWGDAQGLRDFAYVTVGTGIGAGLVVAGHSVFGSQHSELGHARIVRISGDSWPGACPFHGDCIEGLASGPAIQARTGKTASALAANDPIWDTVAHALAQLAHLMVVSVAPRRILFGGGVMSAQPHLFPRIRHNLLSSVNGYVSIPDDVGRFVAPPGLGTNAGPFGALAIAADALGSVSR